LTAEIVMGAPRLRVDREGRLLVIAIDHPPENRLTPSLLEELGAALEMLERDMDAAVLTGTGAAFSYGFDLEVIRSWRDEAEARRDLESGNRLLTRLARFPKPVIAAINGHCFGGGLEIALACHFRLCAEKSRLGLPELSIGLVPGLGGARRLAALAGRAKALELIALGDLIPAEEALRLGIVNRILPRSGFMDGVRAFARALLMIDADLVREAIRLVGAAAGGDEDAAAADAVRSFLRFLPRPPAGRT
jgi:enoyl-CoA hydratase/carnithine racemase